MAPKLIEVSADYKDFAEDALKAAVVLLSGYLMTGYRTGFSEPFDKTSSMMISLMIGLGAFYFVVDPHLIRFVVKDGQEGYYVAKRRYR